jgi:hypothetical protein
MWNRPKQVSINGTLYNSFAEAAKGEGVSREAISKLVKRKQSYIIEDYTPNPAPKSIPWEYCGVRYPSVSAAADAHGVDRNKMLRFYRDEAGQSNLRG